MYNESVKLKMSVKSIGGAGRLLCRQERNLIDDCVFESEDFYVNGLIPANQSSF